MKIMKICILMLMKMMMIMRVDQLRVPLLFLWIALMRMPSLWEMDILQIDSSLSTLTPPSIHGAKGTDSNAFCPGPRAPWTSAPLIHRAKGTDSSSAFPFITSKDIDGWHYLTWICLLSYYVKEVQVFQLSWVKVLQNNICTCEKFQKKEFVQTESCMHDAEARKCHPNQFCCQRC